MIHLQRTDSSHPDFVALVALLDADLAAKDGSDHAFYAQFNTIQQIRHVIVAYDDGIAIACGAIKAFDEESMEVKRMFVVPAHRGKGMATTVLQALEDWAVELGFTRSVLETGKRQEEAIRVYQRNGYGVIDNYGQYKGVENSVCFEKVLV